jgi:hypothetical protein
VTSVQVLEWVSRVTPLGVRFRDAVTRRTVEDDLVAIVYPASERELSRTGVINRAGIFVFRDIFGLHAFETAEGDNTRDFAGSDAFWNPLSPPSRYDYTLEVRDPARRFLPFTLPVKLPQRSLLGITFHSPLSSPLLGQTGGPGAFVPVFSAPTRTAPEGMIALRAEIVDTGTSPGGPIAAAYAVIEARAGDEPIVTGVADERGRILLPLPYPKPVITLGSMPTTNVPLQDQTWTVDFTVRYRRRATVPPLMELYDVLSQPAVTAWQTTALTTPWTQTTLAFGRELLLATQGTVSHTLLITP